MPQNKSIMNGADFLEMEPLDEGGYATSRTLFSKIRATQMLPLDPINVAGIISLRYLKNVGSNMDLQWATESLGALQDASSFREMVGLESIKSRHGSYSERKWLDHLHELVKSRVLEEIRNPHNCARVFLRYFEVPKNNTASRSIFDGTALNVLCKKPLCVNLPTLSEVRCAISCFPHGYMLSADMRHEFHQIAFPRGIENFVSILCAGKVFSLKVLPMGFSRAPYFAQCVTWTIEGLRVAGSVRKKIL